MRLPKTKPILVILLLLSSLLSAREVTLTLVASDGGRRVPVEAKQSLWKSPFGGWVATSWPFGMRVDDMPVYEYKSPENRLLDAAGGIFDAPDSDIADRLAVDILGAKREVKPEELGGFRLDRKASARLSLDTGRHVVEPFGIEFTLAADGTVATENPQLYIDADAGAVEIVCHPVVFKTFVDGRSVSAPLRIVCNGTALLEGIEPLLTEFEKKVGPAGGAPAENAFRRMTLFLPASVPGRPYEVNGAIFAVGADGLVTLTGGAKAECVNGREIHLVTAGARPGALKPVTVAAEQASASVSLYTTRNRGMFRRGDPLDLFWCVKNAGAQPAVECDVVLSGRDLRVVLGRIAIPPQAGSGVNSGYMKLDTAALAPGEYDVGADLPGAVCYPLHFRVVQREPVSDYAVYSYVYGAVAPYAGSPVNAYYGAIPAVPGLAPLLDEMDCSLDAALAAQATEPAGPAPEKFLQPSPNEARLMALAALGMRAVLQYPTLMYHEDWNPKHTLPEDLARMRRRLALFVQPMVDVAGLGGVTMGWYASQGGYWEDVPCQDGHQARRNAAAGEWVKAQVEQAANQAAARGIAGAELDRIKQVAGLRASSSVLPNAWAEYLADVKQMAPGLSSHNAIPSWWLGGWSGHSPWAYRTLSHRDAVDYSDYGLTAWGNFRTPAWMNMGNRDGRKLQCNFMANQMHNRIVTSFGATGRGLDGFAMPCKGEYPEGEDAALRRIFERFGSYFSALDPLPDVALYDTDTNPQNVAMHDLARMRRPAMLLGPEDVLAGALDKYRVLFLVHAPEVLYPGVLGAFRKFEAGGGIIVKDRSSAASLPGRDLGFGYEGKQVHPVWGLAYANGEDEFAHLWINFKETREKFLVETFAKIPGIPVTTADPDAVISPLAGKESILCFVANQTLVPTDLTGRWRQYFVLPKNNELIVANGWHVRNLLTGLPAPMEKTSAGQRTVVDFTRMEGAIFLLTKREPTGMAICTERIAPDTVRLTGWLADAADNPLADPMPFEVTLRGPDGAVLFHKFAALSPDLALDVPVPALSGAENVRLEVRDLVIGSAAIRSVSPARPASVVAERTADVIGGTGFIAAFLSARTGPVTVLLDEGQEAFRPAAEQLAALLKKSGRDARVLMWDPSEVRPLPLRWNPTAEDEAIIAGLRDGKGFAARVALGNVFNPKTGRTGKVLFDDPNCGYNEYGPRLRHDADIVLFGTPADNLAVMQIAPYLRRVPSETYPAPGGFFVHYLWSPFRGGFDGLYVGCRDAAGAAAAVAALRKIVTDSLVPPAPSQPGSPQGTGQQAERIRASERGMPLEDMVTGKFGRPILDIAFAPDGGRVFAIGAGLGMQLFALSPDGTVQATRELHHRRDLRYQPVHGALKALDERTVEVGIGGERYRYSLNLGFVSRWSPPASGFFGKQAVHAATATVLHDDSRMRTYLGGQRRLHAFDSDGRCMWTYDDDAGTMNTAGLMYPRNLYPRAVSGNGQVVLVAGFGSREMLSDAHPANEVLMGFDTSTGAVLWQKSIYLNTGSVIALDEAFLVVDDAGEAHLYKATDGAEAKRLRPIKKGAWVKAVPGGRELLIVENDAFDRSGLAANVFLRFVDGGPDRELPVPGRVADVLVLPDGQSALLSTDCGQTLRMALADGRVLWRAETPSGGILRLTPDGDSIWLGTRDGVLHRIEVATGRQLGKVDLNSYNTTTPEHFVGQMDAVGEVPVATDARTAPPAPVEPSYRTALDAEKVPLGGNMLTESQLRRFLRPVELSAPGGDATAATGVLAPEAEFKLPVEAGQTYLVELLAAVAEPTRRTPQTRLEIAVSAGRNTVNLPYVGRLPLSQRLARRRAAFRADESGEVILTLRAVEPGSGVDGKGAAASYARAVSSPAGLLVAELLVAKLAFKGPNLLLEEGPAAKREPAGELECTVYPWTGGSTLVRTKPYDCVNAAMRCVDGQIANQDGAWTKGADGSVVATGWTVNSATAVVRFNKPQTLTAIAIYEDSTGPVISQDNVHERTSLRYGVYVRKTGARELTYVGHVTDNTQLVTIFACPAVDVSEIHYVWAGRTDTARTDGPVRMVEIEAYADDVSMLLDEALEGDNDGGLLGR